MSLLVCVYTRDESNKLNFHDAANGSEELAGFEYTRYELWGGAATRSLGLTLLPSLASGDLYVEEEALPQLAKEVQVISANLHFVAEHSGYSPEFIAFRLRNILSAIERAMQAHGGVAIF